MLLSTPHTDRLQTDCVAADQGSLQGTAFGSYSTPSRQSIFCAPAPSNPPHDTLADWSPIFLFYLVSGPLETCGRPTTAAAARNEQIAGSYQIGRSRAFPACPCVSLRMYIALYMRPVFSSSPSHQCVVLAALLSDDSHTSSGYLAFHILADQRHLTSFGSP
jgi:hypothetical protein